MGRPITRIIDIDGVLLHHYGAGSCKQWHAPNATIIDGTHDVLDAWEKAGDHIVLMTARPESTREELSRSLREQGIFWHQLIMGVASGLRVLINDYASDGQRTACALNLTRNAGIASIRNGHNNNEGNHFSGGQCEEACE